MYFNPYDVGRCLGISESAVRMALRKMSPKQALKLTNATVHSMNSRKLHNNGENFLTESGVYRLTSQSRKKEAEKFMNWVYDEVLPRIRKAECEAN